MGRRTNAEYGDYQTPPGLACDVCALIAAQGVRPAGLLEPTCGLGNFLFAGLDRFSQVERAVGVDVNPEYILRADAVRRQRSDANRVWLQRADFFAADWRNAIAELPEPTLVLGNLPWVTNSYLGSVGSRNLPKKSNFHNRSGLDAVTGKANFDISEWMLVRLLDALQGRTGTLAMLCKSSVARKALAHAWHVGIPVQQPAIYRIDAEEYFGAAVDAVLLVAHFADGRVEEEAPIYTSLSAQKPESSIGFADQLLLSNVAAYRRWQHLGGGKVARWRSGIKHDCAKVMELAREGGLYRNGLGELTELEEIYVYPMLKSSQLGAAATTVEERCMLVPQRAIGDDTSRIAQHAPLTWAYLSAHADLLNGRGSSIYRHRPPYSVFGVGDYSFSSWKVAISGFYKRLAFVVVGPRGARPVVFDDTCYFLPCFSQQHAELVASLLSSSPAQEYLQAFVFWDAKRPITADLLCRLNLRHVAREIGVEREFDLLSRAQTRELLLWPEAEPCQ